MATMEALEERKHFILAWAKLNTTDQRDVLQVSINQNQQYKTSSLNSLASEKASQEW